MISDDTIFNQLNKCIDETHFDSFGTKYAGKVRECYTKNGKRILITSDRLSCFDVVLTLIPFKGQVLTDLAMFWFDKIQDIIPHHVISHPDPNVIIGKEVKVIPVEVVVRQFLSGSAYRDYVAQKQVSGITLPKGLKKDQIFDSLIITPSTKAEHGTHDEPISEQEIINKAIVSSSLWGQIREVAFKLFERGSALVAKQGLILVDTKYEFGLDEKNNLILVDEIHTLDSSRYWVESEYEARFNANEDQLMLDKEPIRQWLLKQGYKGEGAAPEFTDIHRVEIAKHYISSYEKISGMQFLASEGDPVARILKHLKEQNLD